MGGLRFCCDRAKTNNGNGGNEGGAKLLGRGIGDEMTMYAIAIEQLRAGKNLTMQKGTVEGEQLSMPLR